MSKPKGGHHPKPVEYCPVCTLPENHCVCKGSPVPTSLQIKLASIVVHADEYTSIGGHVYDRLSMRQLLEDQEVQSWIKSLGPLAPVKRRPT